MICEKCNKQTSISISDFSVQEKRFCPHCGSSLYLQVEKEIMDLAQQIRKNNLKKEIKNNNAYKFIRFIGFIFLLFISWRLFEVGFYSGSIFVFILSIILIVIFTSDYHSDIIDYFKKVI